MPQSPVALAASAKNAVQELSSGKAKSVVILGIAQSHVLDYTLETGFLVTKI